MSSAVEGTRGHFALVAEAPGALVALASCIQTGDGVADLGILVEGAYQERGIGARLLARLIEHADRSGLRALSATMLGEQAWVLKVLRAYGPVEVVMSYGVFEVVLGRDRGSGG